MSANDWNEDVKPAGGNQNLNDEEDDWQKYDPFGWSQKVHRGVNNIDSVSFPSFNFFEAKGANIEGKTNTKNNRRNYAPFLIFP